jgi:formate hydrogenlyase subunit 6/NADH:ubiquinone oxidoreductase subunit I
MKQIRRGKTKIKIDYSKCGNDNDPRECVKCMQECTIPVFSLHPKDILKQDQFDPPNWQVTPTFPSLCDRCLRCVDICPVEAITVSW